MKKVFVIAILTALLITGVSITVLSQKTPEKPVYVAQTENIPLNADTIFNLVNAEREKAGIKPLVRDARLDATAQARADDMVARDYFSHNDPVTGENMVNILNGQKHCRDASENISNAIYEKPDMSASVVDSWILSKPHHDAILLADYDLAGIGMNGTKIAFHFCNLK